MEKSTASAVRLNGNLQEQVLEFVRAVVGILFISRGVPGPTSFLRAPWIQEVALGPVRRTYSDTKFPTGISLFVLGLRQASFRRVQQTRWVTNQISLAFAIGFAHQIRHPTCLKVTLWGVGCIVSKFGTSFLDRRKPGKQAAFTRKGNTTCFLTSPGVSLFAVW